MVKFGRISLVAVLVACVATALPVASRGEHPQGGRRGRPRIGLQLYTVRDDCAKDFPGTLKAVGKMGYSGVEFAGYYGRSAEELRKMLDEDGLKCYGTHIGLETLMGDQLKKTVAFNKVLGNRLLVVPWIPEERRNSRATIIETAKLFNEIAKKLEPEGMILAYHDHKDDFKVVDGEVSWVTFFKNTDKRVAIEFDTGNALEGGAQAAPYIAMFPGRVLSTHIKDFSPTKPQVLLGEGDVHWNEVLPLLVGPAGTRWFIIEQETYPFPPLECASKCLRNFEAMLAAK